MCFTPSIGNIAAQELAGFRYEVSPRSSYREGDMRKQFEALTGVKLDDEVSQAIVTVRKDLAL